MKHMMPGDPECHKDAAHYKQMVEGMENDSGGPSRAKAKEMLRHGEVHGKPLTGKQKGYFGAIAGGKARK